MYDFEILRELQGAVKLAVAACTIPALPVKYVGRNYTPPDNQKWLEVLFFPNNITSDFLGNEKNYRGSLRLVLHWPNDDKGAYEAGVVLASISSYFTKSLSLTSVNIYENPDFGGPIENGTEMLYPITIRYSCFRP